MTERELREWLQSADLGLDPRSEERAWRTVRDAYPPLLTRRPRRIGHRVIGAIACLALAAILVLGTLSAPRQAFARLFRDAFGLSARPHTVRVLGGLPGGGRLLVDTENGPWLVTADGSRRYLGSYTSAAWSPHSRYVVAWRGTELSALNLAGDRQWTITAPAMVTVARWSSDGYRIAFLARNSLNIVAGDGSGERTLSRAAAAIPPAWEPHTGIAHRLTFVAHDGTIEQIDTDTGAALWHVKPAVPAVQLLWSPDGSRLLVIGARELAEYSPAGRPLATMAPSPPAVIGSATFISTTRFVLITHPTAGGSDSIELWHTEPNAPQLILYTGTEPLSELEAAPNHQWLLAASPTADQWIFIHTGARPELLATSAITAEFQRHPGVTTTFPRLDGWQH